MNIQSAGFIWQDKQGNAIYGFGTSKAEAWEDVVNNCKFENSEGEQIDPLSNDAKRDFMCYGATQELLDQVKNKGGAIEWEIIDGIACTTEQARNETAGNGLV